MLTKALAWSVLAWIANGVQIWILADKLGAPVGRTIPIALGGYAFAWCVGFVIIFAPAGAGGRDALLVLALGPLLGHNPAFAVALVSRAVNTISDLLVAGYAVATRGRGKEGTDDVAGKVSVPAPADATAPAAPVSSDMS